MIDLPAYRMQKHRSCAKEVSDMQGKVLAKILADSAEALGNARPQLDEAEYKELELRTCCLMTVLSLRPPADGQGWAAASKATADDSIVELDVQAALAKVKDLPVENVRAITTTARVMNEVNEIASKTLESEIREAASKWEDKKLVYKQLGQAVKAATKALTKLVRDHALTSARPPARPSASGLGRLRRPTFGENRSVALRAFSFDPPCVLRALCFDPPGLMAARLIPMQCASGMQLRQQQLLASRSSRRARRSRTRTRRRNPWPRLPPPGS